MQGFRGVFQVQWNNVLVTHNALIIFTFLIIYYSVTQNDKVGAWARIVNLGFLSEIIAA
jgi:hypothetical protein